MSEKENITEDLVFNLLEMTFSEFDKCLEFINKMKNQCISDIAKSDWDNVHYNLSCLMGLKKYSNSDLSDQDAYAIMEESTLAYHAKNYPDYNNKKD